MTPKSLPPGFRFHPTDEELVAYYLARKISGLTIELELIPEVDLYKCEPWMLPEKSLLPSSDMEWYFYSPRDKKYPNGSRKNRATRGGYWKATGKDRVVVSQGNPRGMKKTLVYYKGRAPHGIRTNWIMHEYRLIDPSLCTVYSELKDSYVLCRVFKKVAPLTTEELKERMKKGGGGSTVLKSSRGRRDELDCEEDDGEEGDVEEEVMDLSNEMISIDQIDNFSTSDVTVDLEMGACHHGMHAPFAVDEAMSSVFDMPSFLPQEVHVAGRLGKQLYQPAEVADCQEMGVAPPQKTELVGCYATISDYCSSFFPDAVNSNYYSNL